PPRPPPAAPAPPRPARAGARSPAAFGSIGPLGEDVPRLRAQPVPYRDRGRDASPLVGHPRLELRPRRDPFDLWGVRRRLELPRQVRELVAEQAVGVLSEPAERRRCRLDQPLPGVGPPRLPAERAPREAAPEDEGPGEQEPRRE